MFNNKRIKELEKENVSLREQMFYLKSNVENIDRNSYIDVQPEEYRLGSINYTSCPVTYSSTGVMIEEKKISAKEALELLIKQLGYKITYHQGKSSEYTLDEIPKSKKKAKKRKSK